MGDGGAVVVVMISYSIYSLLSVSLWDNGIVDISVYRKKGYWCRCICRRYMGRLICGWPCVIKQRKRWQVFCIYICNDLSCSWCVTVTPNGGSTIFVAGGCGGGVVPSPDSTSSGWKRVVFVFAGIIKPRTISKKTTQIIKRYIDHIELQCKNNI